jgi:effector-binding domain-containing protein
MNVTPNLSEPTIVTAEEHLTAVVPVEAEFAKLPAAQRAARATLQATLPSLDIGPLGAACTRWSPPMNGRLPMEPGIIVSRAFERAGDVVPSSLPAGRAAHLVMRGSYEGLPAAWQALFAWCTAQGVALAGVNWETYGESSEDPSKIETSLHALLA